MSTRESCSAYASAGKVGLKRQRDTASHQTARLLAKRQEGSAGEDVGNREASCAAGRGQNGAPTVDDGTVIPHKVKRRITRRPKKCTSGRGPRGSESKNVSRYLHTRQSPRSRQAEGAHVGAGHPHAWSSTDGLRKDQWASQVP